MEDTDARNALVILALVAGIALGLSVVVSSFFLYVTREEMASYRALQHYELVRVTRKMQEIYDAQSARIAAIEDHK